MMRTATWEPGTLGCVVLALASVFAGTISARADEEPRRSVRLEPIVVTATRSMEPREAPAASVTVLDEEAIGESANSTVDDVLRTIPGFSLYRRSSSMVTSPNLDPEAQGVTLRNIGPSGASRALVMVDGIPVVDAFDGQVFFSKISKDDIERIEVVRGAQAHLWGNYAMAGAINIITRHPKSNEARVNFSYGSNNTTVDSVSVDGTVGALSIGLDGSFFNTDGYQTVIEEERGPIDGRSSSRHETFDGRVGYALSDKASITMHGQYFDEDRNNGTPLRTGKTNSGLVDLGFHATGDLGDLDARVYSSTQTFKIQYVRALDERRRETRKQFQEIPYEDLAGSLVWSKKVVDPLFLTVGSDFHWIDGESRDTFYDQDGIRSSARVSEGSQFFMGLFAQGIWTPSPMWEVSLGARVDGWNNYGGSQSEQFSDGSNTSDDFDTTLDGRISPRLGLRFIPADWLQLRAAGYFGFRAPTLAELYRQGEVEGLELLPNPDLEAERLHGAEVGFDLLPLANFDLRATGFWSEIEDAIGDVEVDEDAQTGEDTQRMRQNLGLARIVGAEVEAVYEILPGLSVSGSYLFSDGRVERNPEERDLEGKKLTQSPVHCFTVAGRYRNDDLFDFLLEGRFVDDQFEDADNEAKLPSYFLLNASIRRKLPWVNGDVFLAAENLLQEEYLMDRGGGVRKVGTPVMGMAGIRLRWS